MSRTMAGLVALLGVGAVAPVGLQSLGYGLVVAGALLAALALLFGSCLVVGCAGTRHAVDLGMVRGARRRPEIWAGEASARSRETPAASRRLAA